MKKCFAICLLMSGIFSSAHANIKVYVRSVSILTLVKESTFVTSTGQEFPLIKGRKLIEGAYFEVSDLDEPLFIRHLNGLDEDPDTVSFHIITPPSDKKSSLKEVVEKNGFDADYPLYITLQINQGLQGVVMSVAGTKAAPRDEMMRNLGGDTFYPDKNLTRAQELQWILEKAKRSAAP